MNITTVYGKAGTGKSHYIANLIKENIKQNVDFVVLTATHASLENIYEICNKICNSNTDLRSNFKTIYAFFRIDYENNIVLGCKYVPEVIYIDEFSLINKHLFKKILDDINNKIKFRFKLVLSGDPLQLNAIYDIKEKISFRKMRSLSTLIDNNFNINVFEHIHLSIFGMKCVKKSNKIMLTKNLRSKNVVLDTLNAIYTRNREFDFKFIDDCDIVRYINVEDYVFISSKYDILQNIYDKVSQYYKNKIYIEQDISYRLGLKRLYLYSGMNIIVTYTVDNKYFNGETLIFSGNVENGKLKCLNKDNVVVYVDKETINTDSYYPVIPANMMTIHKSQGRSINNVIVCLDEIFDLTMIYTAVTRCRENLVFYTKSINRIDKLFEASYIDEFRMLSSLVSKY